MADNFSIAQELIRGGITFASVIAGAWVALRNHRSNQWWNARHTAYEKAIELLDKVKYALHKFSTSAKAEAQTPTEDRREARVAAQKKCVEIYNELQGLTSRSRFNMAPKAQNILEKVVNQIHDVLRAENYHMVMLLEPWMLIYGTLDDFCEAAKDDLQISPWRNLRRLKQRLKRITGLALKKSRLFMEMIWFGEAEGKRRAAERLKTELATF